MNNDDIQARLVRINAIIPFQKILGRKAEEKDSIAKYYKLNRLAYRFINSKQGFVHMGISRDGKFKDTDFLEHANLISECIEKSDAKSILELAAGKAATTKYLATKNPSIAFTGLDLPNGQLDTSSSRNKNLNLVEGDYHNLSQFSDKSFDIVYIIEALCHARSKAAVIKEVERVLKPGGMFVVFDGYASKARNLMTETEALVSDLTYNSMMVTKDGHLYEDFRNDLVSSSLDIVKEEDLSRFVLPTMERFEEKAIKYFERPLFAKFLNVLLPIEVTGNAVAAYLMPLSVKAGLHQYWVTIAQKRF
jgi:sterol 24-C-methyltransferase